MGRKSIFTTIGTITLAILVFILFAAPVRRYASDLSSVVGILGLVSGGTAADLSATGGANQIVKQTSVGGAFSVAAIVDADIPSAITRDTEWDTEAEVQTAWGAVNIILATEIDISSELAAILTDETGTGVLVFGTAPVFTTTIQTKTNVAKATTADTGVAIFSSSDAANALQLIIQVNSHVTATSRRMTIQSVEEGVAYRDLLLNPAGGNVCIGCTVPGETFHVKRSEVGGSVAIDVENADNTNIISNARFVAVVGGITAGDPFIDFLIPGGARFVVGVDNSDSDKFKISESNILGTNDRLAIDSTGNVGLNTTSFGTNLAKGLAIGLGTDATTNPADQAFAVVKDYAAGDARWYFGSEASGSSRVVLGNGVRIGTNNGDGLVFDSLGTATKGIDLSGSGLSGATDFWFYGDASNYWAANGAIGVKDAIKLYENVATEGNGVLTIRKKPAILAGQTATVASITSFTSPTDAADHEYLVTGFIKITAFTSGAIELEVTFTDHGGVSQTKNISLAPDSGVPQGDANGSGYYAGLPLYISADPNTAITLRTAGTFVATYDVSGTITEVN